MVVHDCELDLVIASVHQRYKADEDQMTERLVKVMRQPFFKIWGHALGRLVLRRDPIKVRIDEVFDAIAEGRAAKRPLAEILLASLAAGGEAGGDKRCGMQRATSAFITVVHADLPFWIPYLSLNVHNLERGNATFGRLG